MINNIFLQISILLGITVSIAFVMRLLRQPIMIAYIIAGIVAGPLFFDLLEGAGQAFDAFAEFGVVLLLFVVGLSLNFTHIKKIGKVSLITGFAQAVFTATAGYIILRALHIPQTAALYLAIALTFSSTIIIVKLLNDKKATESVYGRHVLGLMIVQDMLAIAVMMFITSLNGGVDLGTFFLEIAVKLLGLGALVFLLARFALPKILDHIAHSSEFLFIFTVAWCFGLASLLHWAGFSLEIGAIVAGLTLGSSTYQAEISSRIKPLRDFFIILFFIILGSEMRIGDFGQILLPSIILSLFILFGNPFILYHSFRLLKFTRRNSFLAGITAAQVSEFGFILLFTGYQLGQLPEFILPIFTTVALITIFVSSYAVTYSDGLYRLLVPFFNLFGPDRHRQHEEIKKPYRVWVFGYHRMGWKICEALQQKGYRFAVVDFNPKIIERLEERGIPAFFGDASDVEFLETLPLAKAKLIISTLPEPADQITLVKHVKKAPRPPRIIANLYHKKYLNDLYRAGADYVMMPHLLGGSWIAHILRTKPWTKQTFEKLKNEQKDEMKLRFARETHAASS